MSTFDEGWEERSRRLAKLAADLERQLAEARSCDIWLTDNLSLWMAFMMKAHRDADRALAEAQGKLDAVVHECEDVGEPIAWDAKYEFAQRLLAILFKEGNDG